LPQDAQPVTVGDGVVGLFYDLAGTQGKRADVCRIVLELLHPKVLLYPPVWYGAVGLEEGLGQVSLSHPVFLELVPVAELDV